MHAEAAVIALAVTVALFVVYVLCKSSSDSEREYERMRDEWIESQKR